MGSGRTGQYGATGTLHPGSWAVSRAFPATYERQGSRTLTSQTQIACDPSEA